MSETHLELLMNMPYLSMNFLTLLEHNKNKKFSKKHYKSIILKFINSYNFDNMNIDKPRLIETVNKYGDNLIKSSIDTLEKKYNKLTEQLNTQFGGSNQLEDFDVESAITNWLPGEEAIFSHVFSGYLLLPESKTQIIITNYGRTIVVDLPDNVGASTVWKYLTNGELIDEKTDVLKLGGEPKNLNKLEIDMIKTLSKKPIDWVFRRDGIGYKGWTTIHSFSIYLIDKSESFGHATVPEYSFYYNNALYAISELVLRSEKCPEYQRNCKSRVSQFRPKTITSTRIPTITPPNSSLINSDVHGLNTQLLDNNYSNRSQDFLYIQITMIFVLCLFIFYNKDKLLKKIKSLLITEIETREQWASRITETYRPASINNNLNNNLNSNLKLRRYGPETISDDLELGQDSEENRCSHNNIFKPSRIRSKKNISRNMELERIKRELDVIQSPNPSYYTDTTKHEYTNRSKKKNFNKKNESLRNINNFNNLL